MRRSFSRTSNGPGALVPSPMFVAATVRLLLPRRSRSSAPDNESALRVSGGRRHSHGLTAGAGIPQGEDQGARLHQRVNGRHRATRQRFRLGTQRIRLPFIGCRFVMDRPNWDRSGGGGGSVSWPEGPCQDDAVEAPVSEELRSALAASQSSGRSPAGVPAATAG